MTVAQSTDTRQPTAEHVLPDRLDWQGAILADRKLTPKARLLLLVLGAHFNFRRDARWTISNATLLAETGWQHKDTLAAAIAEARSAGYVIVKRRPGPSEFTAALPEGCRKNRLASAPKVAGKTGPKVAGKTGPQRTDPFTDQRRARTRERLRLLNHDEWDAIADDHCSDWPGYRSNTEAAS